ncbi:dinitrogenase iron-molybdenum cofactor biosynthesis protein [Pseudomonas sp. GCM10022188]|uniref:dinitrogenase iron-molybdenum cofactor biosynthesis protein n=1 Tax=Pseudomonas TaxID=286 RepID=UPI001E2D9E4D|nr:dinitrogenase iron-molybdenum cofactor biosynthesis protein [Pseudomonas oryzagri]MCC6076250.1 dinitrogenase iron-molybdenum cofactor biosynthesis protein [Pseudomonas oryzagri]
MNTPMNLSRETALRIALAARVLPGIGVARLLDMLQQSIPGPLTEESLQTITVTNLKTGFASADGEEDGEDISIGLPAIKEAVRILWGELAADDLPQPVVLERIPERSIRVAIASNTGENLDGHFGSCLRFLIYQVSADEKALVDVRSALEADFAEDKNGFRVDLIRDCQVLYVVSVGGPAAAKVVRADIYPMKKLEGGQAQDILAELQAVMAGSPPPWLAKHLGVAAEERVRFSRSDEVA